MQDNKLRIRTYRQVWRLEQVIYQIERVRLPFPVTFRQMGIFALSLMVMVVVSQVPPLPATSPVLRYALIPGLAAWYLTNKRLDGKAPHRWVLSVLRYLAGPKRYNRFRPLDGAKPKVRLTARVSFRVVTTDDGEG